MTENLKTIALGCDHAAFDLKASFLDALQARGLTVVDFGVMSKDSADYPDIALPLAHAVAEKREGVEAGVLLCGSGVGMSIAANRVPGVRAALCWSREVARLSKEHNNANVLVLPGRAAGIDAPLDILAAWLETPFGGVERHARRIAKIDGIPRAT